jgi:drug/metabolite transporter (DMT)-like permease
VSGATSRGAAVATMLMATLMWSIAGIVSRQLESARGFEVTFWRSAATIASLVAILGVMRGPRRLWNDMAGGGWPLVVSSLCWSVMFTAFMMALTLTTVANVLVTMALGPLFTALLAAVALRHSLPLRTWIAIVVAGVGIVWMVGEPMAGGTTGHLGGIAVALLVPIAGAINWVLLQHLAYKARLDEGSEAQDMMPALIGGAIISCLVTLPLAWPLAASGRDIAWLSMLGLVQLAIPCLLAVRVARSLSAPEISLLALTEVLFGVAWAWLGTSESPTQGVVIGGALVVGALAVNEWLAMRASRALA